MPSNEFFEEENIDNSDILLFELTGYCLGKIDEIFKSLSQELFCSEEKSRLLKETRSHDINKKEPIKKTNAMALGRVPMPNLNR